MGPQVETSRIALRPKDDFTLDQMILLGIPDVDAVVIAVPVRAGRVIVFVPAAVGTVNVMVPEVSPPKMSEDIIYSPKLLFWFLIR